MYKFEKNFDCHVMVIVFSQNHTQDGHSCLTICCIVTGNMLPKILAAKKYVSNKLPDKRLTAEG